MAARPKVPVRYPSGGPNLKEREGLYVRAAEAVRHLVTFERRISPQWDAKSLKAWRVTDSVLRMFFGARVFPAQAQLLDRLFRVLDGRDLGEDERTQLAVQIVRRRLRSFAAAAPQKRLEIARLLVLSLLTSTGKGWAPLLDREAETVAILGRTLKSAGRSRLSSLGVIIELRRGLTVLGIPRKLDSAAVRNVIQQRLRRANGTQTKAPKKSQTNAKQRARTKLRVTK